MAGAMYGVIPLAALPRVKARSRLAWASSFDSAAVADTEVESGREELCGV